MNWKKDFIRHLSFVMALVFGTTSGAFISTGMVVKSTELLLTGVLFILIGTVLLIYHLRN